MLTQSALEARKPNARWQYITPEAAVKEIIKCGMSFPYFVDNFVYIQDKEEKDWIPFQMWDAQADAARIFQQENRIVVLKARQLGLSWLSVAFADWHMLFSPIAEILGFSKTEREAKDLLERAKGIYTRLPSWMKAKSILRNKETSWRLSNGSRFQVLPRTGGDSYAATLIIFDEADHVQDFGKVYNRARPAVGRSGKIFIISTTDKDNPESRYKKIFMAAYQGKTNTTPVFIPYYAHPERDDEWYEKEREDYIEENGSDDEFLAHYPRTPEDALKARTLNKFFPPKWLERAFDDSPPIYHIGKDNIEPPEGVPIVNDLLIYMTPQNGHSYIIGIDSAEGKKTSNDTALTVLDARTLSEVAHLNGRIDATTTGKIACKLADYYNDAAIMPERNNHGHSVIASIKAQGDYLILFGLDGDLGWQTNTVSKPIMYDYTFDAFHQGICVLRTQKTMIQLLSIERNTLSAPPNMLDDCADSFALCVASVLERKAREGWAGYIGGL